MQQVDQQAWAEIGLTADTYPSEVERAEAERQWERQERDERRNWERWSS